MRDGDVEYNLKPMTTRYVGHLHAPRSFFLLTYHVFTHPVMSICTISHNHQR